MRLFMLTKTDLFAFTRCPLIKTTSMSIQT